MKRILSLIAAVTLFATVTKAGNENPNDAGIVCYIGKVNEQPVYSLSLHNDSSAAYYVNIKDADDNQLFAEKIAGAQLVRNYQLEDVPGTDYTLTFEVTNLQTNTTNVYHINKTNKVFDEVTINQVK